MWPLFYECTLIARFMGPIWGWQDPGGPHVGLMNLAIWVVFKLLQLISWAFSYKIVVRWMLQKSIDDKSTLVQVMAWCHQAPSHYLDQCWPISMSSYGFPRPQWVDQKPIVSLLVLRMRYSRNSTRSIPWMLIPWFLLSPGHQQPWYWLHWINTALSSIREDINYIHHLLVEKKKYMCLYFLKTTQHEKG